LQHLQADTAPAIQPETGDPLDGNPAFIPGSDVEGVDQDVGVDKLATGSSPLMQRIPAPRNLTLSSEIIAPRQVR